ncbi:hypothetical protein DE146DRAFT_372227 [Phaeosphaeria sp. MPI-PUGE-AT-0046c]|nr:hypothetical protein DE146DRAFT_372227 [Phaeosphaeria sp. MPI-PUGE-AT-0046c]
MPRDEDPHTYDEHQEAGTVSPNRPPQFNLSNCGYRCGWGCCEPIGGDDGDDGGYESDATPTLIGSDDELERTELQDEIDALPTGISDLQRMIENEPAPIVIYDFEDNILLNLPVPVQAEMFSSEHSEWDYQGSADRLEHESASGNHSSAASDRQSIGSASPSGWDAGMGAWDVMDEAGRNYFCATPLRLSPYYEHCRGNAASHLVVQDYSMLLEPGVEDFRMRMLFHGSLLRSCEVSIDSGSVSTD